MKRHVEPAVAQWACRLIAPFIPLAATSVLYWSTGRRGRPVNERTWRCSCAPLRANASVLTGAVALLAAPAAHAGELSATDAQLTSLHRLGHDLAAVTSSVLWDAAGGALRVCACAHHVPRLHRMLP